MIGRALTRLLRPWLPPPYTDEIHAATIAAAIEQAERLVGTCSTCGADMRLLLDEHPRRVVCDCGDAIPAAFLKARL